MDLKNKIQTVILVVGGITALVTLFTYIVPAVQKINNVFGSHDTIQKMQKADSIILERIEHLENHVDYAEKQDAFKSQSWAVTVRSNKDGSLTYVDERKGVYRVFVHPTNNRFYYYNEVGIAYYCNTKRRVGVINSEEDNNHRPLIRPTVSDTMFNR